MRALFIVAILTISAVIRLPVNAANLFLPPADTAHFYTKHSYDVLKYNLKVDLYQCFVLPYPRSFSAEQIITLKVDSSLNQIKLNAISSSIDIDSVSLAGVSFIHKSDTIYINLDRSYKPGEILNVQIYYRHKNVNDKGFYAYYGTVFTDSPPEGARKWMPCWDRPSDKATWELTASVKSPAQLGSTGLMVEPPIVTGDTTTYHWKSDMQVSTYLITFSSKINFETLQKFYPKFSNPSDSIPILIYHKPGENVALIDSSIIPLTDFFASKFGDYPFEKIGFATLNTIFPWGGMENQSLVSLQPNGYSDLNLIAHEHSHQWFGDMITCGTWADIWLNEGFGTYCQNLWVEHNEGFNAYKSGMNNLANYYLASNPGWPLYHPEWAISTPSSNYLYNQAISYNKGACVLFQLRYVMGDSLFFKAMRDYASDPNLMYKNAFTEDFVNIVNKTAGKDLTWFFDEWVYGANHPEYSNTFQVDSVGAGLWKTVLIVNQ
ncbi:MAG: M1 family metallopeptidase, partial [Bacteroidetes bacterium]|nr:M1 family metallopeptidase [Bacteroidota bacterium]